MKVISRSLICGSVAALLALPSVAQAPQPDSSVVSMAAGPHLYGPDNPAAMVATDTGKDPVNIIVVVDVTGAPNPAQVEKTAWGQYSIKPGEPVTTTLGSNMKYRFWACTAPYWPFDPASGHQPLWSTPDATVQCSTKKPVPLT